MTYFADLGTITMAAAGPHVRAVGWLDQDHPFPVGDVPAEFIARLKAFAEQWDKSARLAGLHTFLGGHSCEFCGDEGGFGAIGIPAGDILFVAPDLVFHYVVAHRYEPPQEFVEAVLQTPPFDSPEYARLVERFRNLTMSVGDDERIGEAVQSWVNRMRMRIRKPRDD